jgi:CRP-like cAMP-binding protein
MAIDALVKPLLSLPLFRDLAPLQLVEIVRRAERIVYRPGDAIVAENQVGDAAIVIISGSCLRIDDNGDPVQKSRGELVPEGSMIAELAMLIEFVHTTTIIAQGPVKALRITRHRLHQLMEEDPALADHFSASIVARLKLLAKDLKAIDPDGNGAKARSSLPRALTDNATAARTG